MRKGLFGVIVLGLLIGLFVGPINCPASESKPVTITAVSILGADHDTTKALNELKMNVEAISGGRVKIDYRGGPESIPSMQQPKAVMEGVVDLSLTTTGYYTSVVPSVTGNFLTPYSPSEEREVGVYEYHVEQNKKANLRYLGRGDHGIEQALWSKNRIESPRQLAGLKFRSNPIYSAAFKALGIKRVSMEMTDIYTGLERGLVEGLVVPASVVMGFHLNEQIPYMYLPSIWGSSLEFVMNLDKWNDLPGDVQDMIVKAMIKTEKWIEVYYPGTTQQQYQDFKAKGGTIITWTGADAKWYVETAQKAKWDEILALDPTNTPKLIELFKMKQR